MFKRLLRPHSILITLVIIAFIWLLNTIRLNVHYLDPFNNGLKEYEITDVVSAQLAGKSDFYEDRIMIVDSGKPDRDKLARLIDRLTAANARVIGVDFYLEEFRATAADTALQTSLKRSGRVVLACTLKDDNQTDDQLEGISGVDTFFSNHALIGYGNYPSNSTQTIRLVSPQETVNEREIPAFSTAILQQYDPAIKDRYLARNKRVEHINFAGHKESFIASKVDFLLDSLNATELAAAVGDRIVLIGYAPSDQWMNPLLDRHYSPINESYANKSVPDMYGITIHANVLQMVLNEKYIFTVPWWFSSLLSVLICYANVLLFRWIYRRFNAAFHGITRAIQLIEFVLLFLFIALLFHYFRVKIDLKMGILGVLLAYDFIMIYESLVLPKLSFLSRWSTAPLVPDTLQEEE